TDADTDLIPTGVLRFHSSQRSRRVRQTHVACRSTVVTCYRRPRMSLPQRRRAGRIAIFVPCGEGTEPFSKPRCMSAVTSRFPATAGPLLKSESKDPLVDCQPACSLSDQTCRLFVRGLLWARRLHIPGSTPTRRSAPGGAHRP